jgi:hypothetical protein
MSRALILLAVTLLSFGLVVAATVDPPDPLWIGGYWDDDDQDNAVIAILRLPHFLPETSPHIERVILDAPLFVVARDSGVIPPVVATAESRAPPLALLSLV